MNYRPNLLTLAISLIVIFLSQDLRCAAAGNNQDGLNAFISDLVINKQEACCFKGPGTYNLALDGKKWVTFTKSNNSDFFDLELIIGGQEYGSGEDLFLPQGTFKTRIDEETFKRLRTVYFSE